MVTTRSLLVTADRHHERSGERLQTGLGIKTVEVPHYQVHAIAGIRRAKASACRINLSPALFFLSQSPVISGLITELKLVRISLTIRELIASHGLKLQFPVCWKRTTGQIHLGKTFSHSHANTIFALKAGQAPAMGGHGAGVKASCYCAARTTAPSRLCKRISSVSLIHQGDCMQRTGKCFSEKKAGCSCYHQCGRVCSRLCS